MSESKLDKTSSMEKLRSRLPKPSASSKKKSPAPMGTLGCLHRLQLPVVILIYSVYSISTVRAATPKMRDVVQHSPMVVAEGQNAALTCIVQDLGSNTVVWKKWESGKGGPLTAAGVRVTADTRFKVFHDEGGDVWVLAIASARLSDSGMYICEVNTAPVLRSMHNLTVISLKTHIPSNSSESVPTIAYEGEGVFEEAPYSYKGMGSVVGHNYTTCCIANNVSKNCLGFCTLRTILEGSTGEPTQCENEFQQIVKCMADGRDHQPCCVKERVPDICQDLCRGEYTIVTDNVKTHFSCPSHIERTLSCIADGVELLPSQPLNVDAVAISPMSINVSWSVPSRNGDTVTEYVVNVTTLRNFDAPYLELGYGSETTTTVPASTKSSGEKKVTVNNGYDPAHANDSYMQAASSGSSIYKTTVSSIDENAEDKVEAKMMQIKVHGDVKYTEISNLQPFTMYEISVRAFNIHGRSLPSVKVRTLTLAPGVSRPKPNVSVAIPDIQSCCRNNSLASDMCVTKLCDPKMSTEIVIPDLMICAPWAQTMFGCLANGLDRTPCCRERGISEQCAELCSSNFTGRLDFHYFKCLKYVADYKNCWMEGYGVLPSQPQRIRVSNVNSDFAIIHWFAPEKLAESVTGYNIHYRPLSTYETEYKAVENVHFPYILENLYGNGEYEVYVEANNEHGVSQPSSRIVFRTESLKEVEAEVEAEMKTYNETACCVQAGLSSTCLPLCSYDASMSDIRALALTCATEFHTLLRCAAGGRDHRDCCSRRGVTDNCLGVCNARIPDSLLSMAENCLPFIGNIVQCFEEGADLLPGPVSEFHADYVTDSGVALSWEPPENSNVTHYEVHYRVVNPTTVLNPTVSEFSSNQTSLNVTDPNVEVTGLTTNSVYQFFVVAYNEHGTSLPSSIIQLNVSAAQFNGSRVPGVTSAPHSLVVGSHSATWVQIIWQPPLFSHPKDKIHYKVYHRDVKESDYTVNETLVNSINLESLRPNSQYIVYITSKTEKGESLASETLIAWTDPAYSAIVETPRIQPANLLIEGRPMTIVCVALGDPTPTISLYINGGLINQKRNRHLTQVIDNVTRDMDIVSCYADNGYGTPMQASRRIQVSYAPNVTIPAITFSHIGDEAILECKANSYPEPKLGFWKSDKRIPIVDGGKYSLSLETMGQTSYIFTLRIKNISDDDGDEYFCRADNQFGEDTRNITLQVIHPVNERENLTSCCQKEFVKAECMDACSLFMDIDTVINKPECLSDFDKLMKCASDGRDHRSCCIGWGVPRRCLDWCRGEPIHNADLCALQSTKSILKCFQESRDILPGPPQNLHFKVISKTEVLITWDPPLTNPEAAALYRVFWRATGERGSDKVDTPTTSTKITNLKPGLNYEAYVKAGNSYGTSVLTSPLIFNTEENSIAYASTAAGGSGAGVGVGITFLVLVLIAGAVGGIWFFRKKHFGLKPPGAVAFENPSYIREPNADPSHVNGDVGPSNTNGSVPSVANGVSSANGWHVETLHTPRTETEVAPTLYEELRLGSEGVGFRRLK